MKRSTVLVAMVSIALMGCGQEQSKDNFKDEVINVASKEVALVIGAPNGRWFHNQLHCSNELPLLGPYDFTIQENEVVFLGIADHGEWSLDQNSDAKKSYTEFLALNAECFQAGIDDFQLIRFTGKSAGYSFAYSKQKNLMLRYINGQIELIVPFDLEKIKKLAIVDNTEESQPDALLETPETKEGAPI